MAAKNEEKRLADFKRRQRYSKQLHHQPQQPYGSKPQQSIVPSPARPRPLQPGRTDQQRDLRCSGSDPSSDGKKCFRCKRTGHFMRDCPLKKSESSGSSRQTRTQQVSTEDKPQSTLPGEEETQPLDLFDSDEEEGVRQVKVVDTGSCCQLAHVNVLGVPAYGVVDTAADITIMGGKLFSTVAAAARLKKKDFRKPDKVPRTYDRKVFRLDSRARPSIPLYMSRWMQPTNYCCRRVCVDS